MPRTRQTAKKSVGQPAPRIFLTIPVKPQAKPTPVPAPADSMKANLTSPEPATVAEVDDGLDMVSSTSAFS
jgi:hypothetical protein